MSTSSLICPPSTSERTAAAIAHGGTLFAWFLAPLIVFLVKRNDSRYVAFQALQALLWSALGTALSLVTCGLAIPVFLVWHIYALIKVTDGGDYEYPVVGDLARAFLR